MDGHMKVVNQNISNSANLCLDVYKITPSVAQMLLSRNPGNRTRSSRVVEHYAAAMERGEWTVGPPIALDQDGDLLDGQHRLLAVVKAKIPVEFAVISGYDRELTFKHFDRGKSRSFADVLHILDVHDSRKVAPVVNILWSMKEQTSTVGGNTYFSPTMDELTAFLDRLGPDRIAYSIKAITPKASRLCRAAMLSALHYYMARTDRLLADSFMDGLGTGVDLETDSPLHHLRELLIKEKMKPSSKRMNTKGKAQYISKAWTLERLGLKVKFLRLRKDEKIRVKDL
jgi:hypothetical protein